MVYFSIIQKSITNISSITHGKERVQEELEQARRERHNEIQANVPLMAYLANSLVGRAPGIKV